MFETKSRYINCEDAKITIVVNYQNNDKREVAYKRRRFIPSSKKMNVIKEIIVKEGQRLDLLTANTIGDPEQFWLLCDSNDVMYPLDLLSNVGSTIRIAIP